MRARATGTAWAVIIAMVISAGALMTWLEEDTYQPKLKALAGGALPVGCRARSRSGTGRAERRRKEMKPQRACCAL